MGNHLWKWVLGLIYLVAVAAIWIASSFVVQNVIEGGVSPFLITYICNGLFVVYIPLVEIGRYLEDKFGGLMSWRNGKVTALRESKDSERALLIRNYENCDGLNSNLDAVAQREDADPLVIETISGLCGNPDDAGSIGLDQKGRWTRRRVAKVSLLVCPFWFIAQLTFNVSLKYTTVTSNTILSSSSSLFSFLVALVFLREKFTWLKLMGVLFCMGGTIIVSLGDAEAESSVALNPVLGNILAVLSSAFYAVYVTLIRQKLPDEDDKLQGHASMAQFFGFLGLFNVLIFLPVALVMNFAKIESFSNIDGRQFGLIVGKGLLDNVLSDYLWAKAVLLTSTTVATTGLSIQVPLAALVDTLRGAAPNIWDYIGGAAIMLGFTFINIPTNSQISTKETNAELENARVD